MAECDLFTKSIKIKTKAFCRDRGRITTKLYKLNGRKPITLQVLGINQKLKTINKCSYFL